VFAPARHAFVLGQADPLVALFALAGIYWVTSTPTAAGLITATALFIKPQTAALPLLALVLWKRKVLLGCVIAAFLGFSVLLLANRAGLTPGAVTEWLRVARRVVGPPGLLPTAFQMTLAIAALSLLTLRWKGRPVSLLEWSAAGAALNAIVGSLVHLEPYSNILLILPLMVVHRAARERTVRRWTSLLLGVVLGSLSGDGLFAISYDEGWRHAIIPWITVAAFGAAIVLVRQRLARILGIAIVANAILTFPPLPPAIQIQLAAVAGFILIVLLAERHPATGPC
jgi:hypothetical protein